MKILLTAFFALSISLFLSSCTGNKTESSTRDTTETANERPAAVTPDFRSYPQYVSCKINGQPYLAYYTEDHITGITNALNLPSQVVFATSADQYTVNGKTTISELTITFFGLGKTVAGTLTSNTEFYLQGHTDFPAGNDLKYVSFTTKAGQHLALNTVKNGMLEGTFAMDVVDESDPANILKITEGIFKLKQAGKTTSINSNGDVNVDSILKNIQ